MAAFLPFLLVLVSGAPACQSADCALGLVRVDGQCKPDPTNGCGQCDVHEFCDESVTPNVCRCAPGYAGSPCNFIGLIADPGFQQSAGVGSWSGEKGAMVDPSASGGRDAGEGVLDGRAVCDAGALLQAVEMPSYATSGPFVVEISYIAEEVHGLAIGFNQSWTRLAPAGPPWHAEQFCLGDGGYGRDPSGGLVEVRISASERDPNCYDAEPGGSIRVDRFRIRPAEEDECTLAFGKVLNGTAEKTGASWDFEREGSVEAGFALSVGRLGSSGARIARDAGQTGRASMTTQISVPLPATLTSPALTFWWRGTSGALFEVELGTSVDFDDRGRQVDTLVGTGSGLDYIYCLPPWTNGSILELSFSFPDDGAAAVELVADNVAITTDPDCGSERDLLDPSFESAPNRWFGSSVTSIFDMVNLQPDAPLARMGDSVLEFSYETEDAKLAMEAYVLVPQSVGDEGPVVAFYSLNPATSSSTAQLQWVLGRSEVEKGAVLAQSSWQMNEVCLPPEWAGRWFRLQVEAHSPDGLSSERVLLDDFSLGTSSACRAQ